jgi:hypothetical protein
MKLFVEGGGGSKALRTACREGFAEFLQKAGLGRTMPRIIASGSRRSAYDDFCTAVADGQPALLLVDSEASVVQQHQQGDDKARWAPWAHLAQRQGDGWAQPSGADDKDCHLMVQCMESWFLADRQTLQTFFDPGFKPNALPAESRPIEGIDKDTLYQALKTATANCKTKAEYGKGEHSFKLLTRIDPQKVTAASGWAERFVAEVKARMGAT